MLIVLLISIAALLPFAAAAKLDIAVYNETSIKFNEDANSDTGNTDWFLANWADNPRLYFDLKLSGTILKDTIYFWSKWGGENKDKDDIDLSAWEAHIQFKFKRNLLGGSGELILFQNQDRWNLGNPIYKDLVTEPNDGKNNQIGIWIDTYDVLTLNELKGFVAVSDPRLLGTSTNDTSFRHTAFALRVRKDFLGNKLKVGAMQHINWWFNKEHLEDDKHDPDDDYYSMTSFDLQVTLVPNMFFGGELAYTFRPFNKDYNPRDHKAFAGKFVLSYALNFRKLGQLYFYGYVAFAGEDFDLSGRGSTKFPDLKAPQGGSDADIDNEDRYVEFIELTYNFPLKAIYLKSNLAYCHRISDWGGGSFHLWNMKKKIGGQHISEIDPAAFIMNWNELSIEFINGFYFKSQLVNYSGKNLYKGVAGSWKNLILELSVENKLARIKPQVAFYNMGDEIYGAMAFGGELLLNLTRNFKLYTRFAIFSSTTDYAGAYVNTDGHKSWGSFYIELQYFGLSNTEIYLRFGDGSKNEHLAQTYNLVAGGAVENVLEFQLKFWL